ncbi:type I secretion system permease/ATPase [Celeribacter marinus]|uniref:type I secretion system permease/ATPase n=1 Tax=Celeribacter marinus TaxID=1397108 RepID=UPI00317D8B96
MDDSLRMKSISKDQIHQGHEELSRIRAQSRGLYWGTAVFSVVINALMLTGPLFMLQVYDRVLGSGSEATLVALFGIVAFLYLLMGLLDGVRGRVLSRIGARFQSSLEDRVFNAAMDRAARNPREKQRSSPMDDLSAVRRYISSPIQAAMFDLPFTPVFLLGIALFHPYLGLLAVGGGIIIVIVALWHRAAAKDPQAASQRAEANAANMAMRMASSSEALKSLGMQRAAFRRWLAARHIALTSAVETSDTTHSFSAASKALRLFLQSAMLAMGAWLVLGRELTPGAMIAGSILLGRALQPIDTLIGQWAVLQGATRGRENIAELLGAHPVVSDRMALPRPKAVLDVSNLTVIPPGQSQASLRMVSFDVRPGEAVGIIGPSGAGKSTLARALTGVWAASGGTIRLDSAKLDHYPDETRGDYIGYLPQSVELFDGTIAENIAKLALSPDHEAVVTAAKKAAAHEMILALPDGYDTQVSSSGGLLSGGQLQRIGLARAFFGTPVLVILDEPNSNLDNEGTMALNTAIRSHKAEGGAILIMAHRPSAIEECERLLVLNGGARRAFGPKDAVLKETVQNSADIQRGGMGGVQ